LLDLYEEICFNCLVLISIKASSLVKKNINDESPSEPCIGVGARPKSGNKAGGGKRKSKVKHNQETSQKPHDQSCDVCVKVPIFQIRTCSFYSYL